VKKVKNRESDFKECASRIIKVREHLKLNQLEFSNKIGFQNSQISQVESGQREVTKKMIINMAKVLDISPTWILLGKGSMFLNNHDLDIHDMDPNIQKLNWYCQNSPYVKHVVLGHFLRILHVDKKIIQDDINGLESSTDDKNTRK
jgi:transcriptional regulator with XRE-family HTH domain